MSRVTPAPTPGGHHPRRGWPDESCSRKTFYATNEAEQHTCRGTIDSYGSMTGITPLVEQGAKASFRKSREMSIPPRDRSSSVPVPDTLDIPERPHDILFSGKDGHMLTDASLYSVRTFHNGL